MNIAYLIDITGDNRWKESAAKQYASSLGMGHCYWGYDKIAVLWPVMPKDSVDLENKLFVIQKTFAELT